MKELTEEKIKEMRTVRDNLISSYSARDEMLKRYEEIFFMTRAEKPRELNGTAPEDIKETISSSGRDAVIGMKRILDSGKVHIDVKGEGGNPDEIEKGLKAMLRVSGEYRIASVEKDLTLSASLYGPSVATVESVDDLIETQKSGDGGYKNAYVAQQLQRLRKKTPFLIHTINPPQSYPLFGAFGMIGHARVYKLKGAEITNKWGVECKPTEDYTVRDFFYYENRLVEAEGISKPLMAVEWVSRDKTGEIIGSINIPVFTRYAGGSHLFNEPDKQSQPLLYAKAKGEWDLRENLYYTYLFTAIYQQGLPGPLLLVKPENADTDVEVNYKNGVRTLVADGQIANTNVIDGDVIQLGNLLDKQAATQTIQPQTLGTSPAGVTFSQFALSSKAGMIPAVDPKESMEALYEDMFTHILERIEAESIDNDLLKAADIPKDFKIIVSIEPDLEQDDLRNASIALQLKNAGLGSGEWIDTNILKIPDSKEVWKQRKMEEMRDAMMEIIKSPEFLQPLVQQQMQKFMPKKPPTQTPPPADNAAMPTPPEGADMPTSNMPNTPGMPGMEQLPQTDAMIPENERR